MAKPPNPPGSIFWVVFLLAAYKFILLLTNFSGAFLCRAVVGPSYWTRLATANHLITLFVTIGRCSLEVSGRVTELLGKNCSPIYVLGLDPKFHIRKRIETSETFEISQGNFPGYFPFWSPMKMFVWIQFCHQQKFVSSRPQICKQQAGNFTAPSLKHFISNKVIGSDPTCLEQPCCFKNFWVWTNFSGTEKF